jgi:hypothetical protein
MNDITALRELRPAPPPAELEAMRMAARQRFAAGTAPAPAPATGRAGQRWRRPVLAGGLVMGAAAAGVAAALILTSGVGAVPGQHASGGHSRTVVTTAWTVREAADGTVSITLQEYSDPAGLQQTLEADGIDAIVRAIPYTLRTAVNLNKPIVYPTCNYDTLNDREPLSVQGAVLTVGREALPALFVIHPDAMPAGSALFLAFMASPPNATGSIALKPVVLSNDTVPTCVPVAAKPAPGTPPVGNKAGSPAPAPSALPKAA